MQRLISWWKHKREQRMLNRFVQDIVAETKDFWLWHIPEAVQWDMEEQCWAVTVRSHGDIRFTPGEEVALINGRGGAREYALIVSVQELDSGDGAYYCVDFDG